MIYYFGDLMDEARSESSPTIITTNGDVKGNGDAVMGAGIALQARDDIPGLALLLGSLIHDHGNRPFRLHGGIWTLPVKHHWKEKADIVLIEQSLVLMLAMVIKFEPQILKFPKPGCGNGALRWQEDGIEGLMEAFATAVIPTQTEIWDFQSVRTPEDEGLIRGIDW